MNKQTDQPPKEWLDEFEKKTKALKEYLVGKGYDEFLDKGLEVKNE